MSQRSLLDPLLVFDTEWPIQIHLAKPPTPRDVEFTKCTIANENMCRLSYSTYMQKKLNGACFDALALRIKK